MNKKMKYIAPGTEISASEVVNRLCGESVVDCAVNNLLLINSQHVNEIDYSGKNEDGSDKFNQVWE